MSPRDGSTAEFVPQQVPSGPGRRWGRVRRLRLELTEGLLQDVEDTTRRRSLRGYGVVSLTTLALAIRHRST